MTRSRCFFFGATALLAAAAALLASEPAPTHADAPPPAPVLAAANSTYSRDIRPLVAAHCVSCHQEKGPAPFPLTTYRDVEKRAVQIVQVTQSGLMPPWKPDSHGELVGENILTAPERARFQTWGDAKAPEGEPVTAPIPAPAVEANPLGKPDLVLTPSSPVQIAAGASDFYCCFLLPTSFGKDRYVQAMEFLPGSLAAADHAVEYIDPRHRVRMMNSLKSGEKFVVTRPVTGLQPEMVAGAWGIPTPPLRLPAGCGMLLPSGADIILQVHYHGTGKPETDLPRLALHLNKEPVVRRVRVAPIVAQNIRLRPRFVDRVGGQSPVLSDISVVAVLPYLRHRGDAVMLRALHPDKSWQDLVNVPQWDFGWVGPYQYREPQKIPAGSVLSLNAVLGSEVTTSDDAGVVTWGDRTEDENAVAYVFYTTDKESPGGRGPGGVPDLSAPRGVALTRTLLKMFDENNDGAIEQNEYNQLLGFFRTGIPSMTGMEM